jgi:hypothetical protein
LASSSSVVAGMKSGLRIAEMDLLALRDRDDAGVAFRAQGVGETPDVVEAIGPKSP